jgi:hypothetical protein
MFFSVIGWHLTEAYFLLHYFLGPSKKFECSLAGIPFFQSARNFILFIYLFIYLLSHEPDVFMGKKSKRKKIRAGLYTG